MACGHWEVLCTLFMRVLLQPRLVNLIETMHLYRMPTVRQPVITSQRPVNNFSRDDLLQSETMDYTLRLHFAFRLPYLTALHDLPDDPSACDSKDMEKCAT